MMVDAGTLLLCIGFFFVGMISGRVTKRKPRSSTPQPICGCEHGLNAHDPKTGVCHDRVQLNSWGEKTKWGECKCRQYTGPRPLEQLWIPEVMQIPPHLMEGKED